MSIQYQIVPESKLMVTVWKGIVTAEQWQAHLKSVFESPVFPTVSKHLSDLRLASTSAIDEKALHAVAHFIRSYSEQVAERTIAVVATEGFQRSVQFQELLGMQSVNLIVFTEMNTACLWLGVDTSATERVIEEIKNRQEDKQ